MYNTLKISQESWIYAAHKSCLRHFLCVCGALLFGNTTVKV